MCRSVISNDKMVDDRSMSSTGSSVGDVVHSFRSETKRNKMRLRKDNKPANRHDVPQPKSIMVTRTQKESLEGGTIVDMKKQRRRFQLSFDIDSLDSCDSTRSNDTKVSFDSVQIRQYPVIPGDNPCVYEGPPITIGWKHFAVFSTKIDNYERHRAKKRRETAQMRIPAYIRKYLLLDQGHSEKAIDHATEEAARVRKDRDKTLEGLPTAFIEEKIEMFQSFFTKRRRERKEQVRPILQAAF